MNFGGRTVTGNTEYQVQFALDENGNNIPDYLEDKYEVKVTAGENGSVEPGYSNNQVLADYALANYGFNVETAKPDRNYAVDKWIIVGAGANGADQVLAAATAKDSAPVTMNLSNEKVTRNTEYRVIFAEDSNGNNIPDYLERYTLTVTYTYHADDLVAGETAPVMPQVHTESGMKVHDTYKVSSPQVDGWVAVPQEVNGTIVDSDVRETVIYHKDANHDQIPDDYQVTITYRVENGGWNAGGSNTVVEILTLEKDGVPAVDGTVSYTTPEAGNAPAIGYKAGAWNVPDVPTTFTKADDNKVYIYTYAKDSFRLTVKHVYTAVDGTQTEQIIKDNADTEFETPLSYQAASAGNYTFSGVEVKGLEDTNTTPEIVEGTMPAGEVVLIFHYDEDSKGTGENPDEPDGIPDKYQVTFVYQATGKGGTVSGKTREVVNLYEEFQKDENGVITPVRAKAANPTQPSRVEPIDPNTYYFQHWMEDKELIGDDGNLKARAYTEPGIYIFTAYFREVPNNDWDVDKDVTNLPARGYFRVGEEAHFVITVENVGNRDLKNIRIEEQLKGATIIPGSGYDIENGVAVIQSLKVGRKVSIGAVYVVTRNDLFNRQFRNIVRSTAEFTEVEPGTPERLTPVTADSGQIPAGAQGGGSSSGGGSGGGSGSSTRSPGTGGGTAGGPGAQTVTIDPDEVPLANLPDMGNDDILALIDDEEIPLAALPKTGQATSAALMLMLSSMMLAAFAAVTRKKEEEQ